MWCTAVRVLRVKCSDDCGMWVKETKQLIFPPVDNDISRLIACRPYKWIIFSLNAWWYHVHRGITVKASITPLKIPATILRKNFVTRRLWDHNPSNVYWTVYHCDNWRMKKPTSCHLIFYCTSYRLNMFRALLCPLSGARDYDVVYHIGRVVFGLLYVGGEMRLGWSSVRVAGPSTSYSITVRPFDTVGQAIRNPIFTTMFKSHPPHHTLFPYHLFWYFIPNIYIYMRVCVFWCICHLFYIYIYIYITSGFCTLKSQRARSLFSPKRAKRLTKWSVYCVKTCSLRLARSHSLPEQMQRRRNQRLIPIITKLCHDNNA